MIKKHLYLYGLKSDKTCSLLTSASASPQYQGQNIRFQYAKQGGDPFGAISKPRLTRLNSKKRIFMNNEYPLYENIARPCKRSDSWCVGDDMFLSRNWRTKHRQRGCSFGSITSRYTTYYAYVSINLTQAQKL